MVSTKTFSLAGLLWLGLASRGLALEIDQNNELTLAERFELLGEASALDTRTMSIQIVPNPGKHVRAVEEIDERDLEELDERDFEELEARNMPGKHRSSWGSQGSGPRRSRDLEERNMPGKHRSSWGGQGGSGPRRPRDLEVRFGKVGPKARLGLAYTARDYDEELETRSMPGKHRSSWSGQGGSSPRRSR